MSLSTSGPARQAASSGAASLMGTSCSKRVVLQADAASQSCALLLRAVQTTPCSRPGTGIATAVPTAVMSMLSPAALLSDPNMLCQLISQCQNLLHNIGGASTGSATGRPPSCRACAASSAACSSTTWTRGWATSRTRRSPSTTRYAPPPGFRPLPAASAPWQLHLDTKNVHLLLLCLQ